jgi:hypothetical protein
VKGATSGDRHRREHRRQWVVEEDETPQALALRQRAKLIAPELLGRVLAHGCAAQLSRPQHPQGLSSGRPRGRRARSIISLILNEFFQLAGGPGFEPRLTESESAVLPLNYPPKPWDFSRLRALGAGRRCRLPCPHLRRALPFRASPPCCQDRLRRGAFSRLRPGSIGQGCVTAMPPGVRPMRH